MPEAIKYQDSPSRGFSYKAVNQTSDEKFLSKMSFEKDNESSESLLSSKPSTEFSGWRTRTQHQKCWWLLTALNTFLFLLSLLFWVLQLHHHVFITELELMKKTSFYSPVFDTINFKLHDYETEGGLFEAERPSIYRDALAPDAAVDDAWEDLEVIRVFPITESQVRKLGKDPELAVKFPPEYGLGENAYMAQIDMFHQIHCLNLLRGLAWAEYDRNGTAKKPFTDLHWVHVSHCTDILMQNLMCNGNLDIITFNWMETQSNPFPDFNVVHKCRDFDAIYEWQDKHAVPKEWGRNVTRPKGAKQVPISEEYYRIYGLNHTTEDNAESHNA